MSKKGIVFVLVLFLLNIFIAIAMDGTKASEHHIHGAGGEYVEITPTPTDTPIPTITPIGTSTPTRVLPTPMPTPTAREQRSAPSGAVAQDLAIQAIKQESLVRDAAIRRDGDTFNLVLVVNAGTNVEAAKRYGENFVRLFKTYSDDENPGQDICTGKYHYIIGVYYPNEKEVAFGAKSSITPWITWN